MQEPRRSICFSRGYPMDLIEQSMVQVLRQYAISQAAQLPELIALSKKHTAKSIHANYLHLRKEFLEKNRCAAYRSTGTHGSHQAVNAAQSFNQLGGKERIGSRIAGIVILTDPPMVWDLFADFRQTVKAGLLISPRG